MKNARKKSNSDIIGNMLYHGKVMGDKQHRQMPFFLQGHQEVHDLRLDRYVKC